MDELDRSFLIVIGIALILGVIMFFLSGVFHTKKDKAIVIEKAGKFKGVYYEGWHFFMPLVYQRRGTYLVCNQKIRVKVKDGPTLEVTYKIEDVKKYHYEGQPVEVIVNRVRKENENITTDILKEYFQRYGLKFINIERAMI